MTPYPWPRLSLQFPESSLLKKMWYLAKQRWDHYLVRQNLFKYDSLWKWEMKQAKPLIFTVRCICTHTSCSWSHLQAQSKCCFSDQVSVFNLGDSCFYLGKGKKSINFTTCATNPIQSSTISTVASTDHFFFFLPHRFPVKMAHSFIKKQTESPTKHNIH